MKNYKNIIASQRKDYGDKKALKFKEEPRHDSLLFFHDKQYCTFASPEIAFLCFLKVATTSNFSF